MKIADLFQDKSGLEPAEMAIKAKFLFDNSKGMSKNVRSKLF